MSINHLIYHLMIKLIKFIFISIFRSLICLLLSLWITLIIWREIGPFSDRTISKNLYEIGQNLIQKQRKRIWDKLLKIVVSNVCNFCAGIQSDKCFLADMKLYPVLEDVDPAWKRTCQTVGGLLCRPGKISLWFCFPP